MSKQKDYLIYKGKKAVFIRLFQQQYFMPKENGVAFKILRKAKASQGFYIQSNLQI